MKYELSEHDRLELASPVLRADAPRRLASEPIVLTDAGKRPSSPRSAH